MWVGSGARFPSLPRRGRGATHRPLSAPWSAAAFPGPFFRIGAGQGDPPAPPGPALSGYQYQSRSAPWCRSLRAGSCTEVPGKCPDGAGGAVGRAGGYRRDGGCITQAMRGEPE